METTTIATDAATAAREKLHYLIEEMDDVRLVHLYEFLKTEIEDEEIFELPDDVKAELDRRFEAYQNGEKTYSQEEVDAHTHNLLKSLGVRK